MEGMDITRFSRLCVTDSQCRFGETSSVGTGSNASVTLMERDDCPGDLQAFLL